jgi:ankyrin repeat protein
MLGHLSKLHLQMATLTFFLLLLNHDASVDITGIDGRVPLTAAVCNGHLEVNRQLLSVGCSVHIGRKCHLTALLTAADSGLGEVFR